MDEVTIVRLLEGELEGAELHAAEAHLAQCEECRALVGAAGQAARAGLKQPPPHVGPVRLEDRYEVVRFIAAGGMGRVYEAVNRHTGQRVAIKSLAESDEDQAGMLLRFAREGEVLRRLDHPNIVKLLEVVDGGEQQHLVMEFVAGGSLRDLIRREGPLGTGRALRLLLELADALSRAHHLGVLHRDIKPANVLLAEDGTARLTDFGLARMGDSRLTQTGVVLGTVPYLCPEVLWGKPVDARADLWSLGVTLFEMLSGQLPFAGDTQGAIVTAILNQPPRDLRALRPATPVALVDLLHRMLEKDPERRITSARQVGALTEAVLSELGSGRTSGWRAFPDPAAGSDLSASATVAVPVAPAKVSPSGGSVRALESSGRSLTPGLSGRRAGWGALLVLAAGGAVWMIVSVRRAIVTAPEIAQTQAFARPPPPPLAVDDFEDGDTVPRDARFAHWQRYHYNTSGPGPVHAWAAPPASGSNQSLHLAWMVQDAQNGKSDFPGAGVRTLASNVFVDLSPYSRLVFAQRYQAEAAFPSGWTAGLDKLPGKPPGKLPPQAEREAMLLQGIERCAHSRPTALVQLFCAEYKTFFEVEFPLSEDWQPVVVPFSSLHESYWKPPTNTPLASCLAVTDGVSFIVQDNQLADGQCHSGSLSLDDISFR